MKNYCLLKDIRTGILVFGLAVGSPVLAQMGGGMMGGSNSGNAGMTQMSGTLHDMGGYMQSMAGQLAQGNMTPEMQKQMAERMRSMSGMMGNMSTMMGNGMMMDDAQLKQLNTMRMQMHNMMK